VELTTIDKTCNEAESSHHLSSNIIILLKKRNLNSSQLAQILNIPLMTIRRLISGETANPRISTLKLIADYFDISIDSLINDATSSLLGSTIQSNKPQFVPIIEWEIAEKINSIKDIDLKKWKDWCPVSLIGKIVLGKESFALESRPSMYPRFPHGSFFVIDPSITPEDGDIVLIRVNNKNTLTLRELVMDPPEWKLNPIIPGSSVLKYSEEDYKITGVVFITMLYNRRNYK
jgi:transcriptional regulator with XRE-family HTH domain